VHAEEAMTPVGTWRVRNARIDFENGLRLSIGWGSGSYGSNTHDSDALEPFTDEPEQVEVAVLWGEEELDLLDEEERGGFVHWAWVDEDGLTTSDVLGYVPVPWVASLVDVVASFASGTRNALIAQEGTVVIADGPDDDHDDDG
jgi:hypothetical protein